MATKKTAQPEEEISQEAAEALKAAEAEMAAEEPVDPWSVEVEVLVPRKRKGDDPQYYVCVNDRRYAFPANGKKQKMPQPIAEVLESSLQAEYEAEEYAEEMSRAAAEAARGQMG